jgi:hypothetical protein
MRFPWFAGRVAKIGFAMPKMPDTTPARMRASFLQESPHAARAGLARGGDLGIDRCSTGQARLRTLLALAFFDHPAVVADGWSMRRLAHYTLTVSPRHNALVLAAVDAPTNVSETLVARNGGHSGVPGLRSVSMHGRGAHILHHIPTGADIVVTSSRAGAAVGGPRHKPRVTSHWLGLDDPLTPAEVDRLARIPRVSPDASALLASLFCRITSRDPAGTWAMGTWFDDPLNWPGRSASNVSLVGADDAWELRWQTFPSPLGVAASLTVPPTGLTGAVQVEDGLRPAIRFGAATLRLSGEA